MKKCKETETLVATDVMIVRTGETISISKVVDATTSATSRTRTEIDVVEGATEKVLVGTSMAIASETRTGGTVIRTVIITVADPTTMMTTTRRGIAVTSARRTMSMDGTRRAISSLMRRARDRAEMGTGVEATWAVTETDKRASGPDLRRAITRTTEEEVEIEGAVEVVTEDLEVAEEAALGIVGGVLRVVATGTMLRSSRALTRSKSPLICTI